MMSIAAVAKLPGASYRYGDSKRGIGASPRVTLLREASLVSSTGAMTYGLHKILFEGKLWNALKDRISFVTHNETLVRGLLIIPMVYWLAEKLSRAVAYKGLKTDSLKSAADVLPVRVPQETVARSSNSSPLHLLNPFASFRPAEPAVQPSFGYAMLQYQAQQPTASPVLQATAPLTGLYNTGLRLNQTI